MAHQASGKYYEIKRNRLGWSAVLFDSKGRSVNVINGDSEESVRMSAQRHWPEVPETRPGRGITSEPRHYPTPNPPPRRFVSPVVRDFSTLPELIRHARGELGATHTHGHGPETRIYLPLGNGQYEEATVWQKANYWHMQGPGSRQHVQRPPQGARPIPAHAGRNAAEDHREHSLDRLYGHTRGRDPYPFPSDRDRGISKLYGPRSGGAGAPTITNPRRSAHKKPR